MSTRHECSHCEEYSHGDGPYGGCDPCRSEAVRAALTELRAEVEALPDHSVSGYEWECYGCHSISLAAVLALIDSRMQG
jgi:hypothetical protein